RQDGDLLVSRAPPTSAAAEKFFVEGGRQWARSGFSVALPAADAAASAGAAGGGGEEMSASGVSEGPPRAQTERGLSGPVRIQAVAGGRRHLERGLLKCKTK